MSPRKPGTTSGSLLLALERLTTTALALKRNFLPGSVCDLIVDRVVDNESDQSRRLLTVALKPKNWPNYSVFEPQGIIQSVAAAMTFSGGSACTKWIDRCANGVMDGDE